jgi:hypothetical protein
MASKGTFLVVEIPGTGLPGTEFTARHPGVTIDTISGRTRSEKGEIDVDVVMMVRGAEPADLDALVGRLTALLGHVTTLRRDAWARLWIGRGTVRESSLKSAAMQAILRFQERFGPPWLHSEDGIVHLRALVSDPQDARSLAHDVQRELDTIKVDAQVAVQEISPHDFSVWEDLVQYNLGLAP